MSDIMSRREAQAFARTFKPFDIYLDDPGWDYGFHDLLDLWDHAAGLDAIPDRRSIDLVKTPGLVGRTQIIEFADADRQTLRTVFQGADLSRYTREETGSFDYSVYKQYPEREKRFAAFVDFTARWPQPFWGDGDLFIWRRGSYTRERFISLPVSTDGKHISGVIYASHLYGMKET